MIRFNNYPPQEPGDIELTDAARETIRIQRNMDSDLKRKTFDAYGVSIGHVLVSSMVDRASYGIEGYRIMGPVFEEVDEIAGSEARGAMHTGFSSAVLVESMPLERIV